MSQLAKIDTFDKAVEMTLLTVRKNSKRVYRDTYNGWQKWCEKNGIQPMSLHHDNIVLFLTDQHVTSATRRRQLSAMRTLVKVLALIPGADDMKFVYEFLRMVEMPDENLSDNERNQRALSPDQVDMILNVWDKQTTIHRRNKALLAFMVATGARRSEVVVMQWRDIDLDEGVAIIRHGKGDKKREVAIVGDYAVDILRAWREMTGSYQFVFVPMDNQGNVVSDKPMGADNLYRIIKQTEKLSGIDFSPHDTRRTHITELMKQGATVSDTQEQAGHSSAATTLRYAKAAGALERRKKFKTRYGG